MDSKVVTHKAHSNSREGLSVRIRISVSLRIRRTGGFVEALYVRKNVRDRLQLVRAHSRVSSELERRGNRGREKPISNGWRTAAASENKASSKSRS